MEIQAKLLAIVKKAYDYTPKEGNNAGQRYTGINYFHYILKADGNVVALKMKTQAMPFSDEDVANLPSVMVTYKTFINEDGQEVLEPETIVPSR